MSCIFTEHLPTTYNRGETNHFRGRHEQLQTQVPGVAVALFVVSELMNLQCVQARRHVSSPSFGEDQGQAQSSSAHACPFCASGHKKLRLLLSEFLA